MPVAYEWSLIFNKYSFLSGFKVNPLFDIVDSGTSKINAKLRSSPLSLKSTVKSKTLPQ